MIVGSIPLREIGNRNLYQLMRISARAVAEDENLLANAVAAKSWDDVDPDVIINSTPDKAIRDN